MTCASGEHPHKPDALSEPRALERAAQLFRALGDAPRLRLLEMLRKGECCVSDLVAACDEKFSTVSQRLRVLRAEGLDTLPQYLADQIYSSGGVV